MSRQPYRLPKGGLIDRDADAPLHLRRAHASPAIRATRSPRRCLRTASTWWRARSSIIVRAASSRAGSEEPAALVEIGADRARIDPNTRVTEQELYRRPEGAAAELLADARPRCRRGRTMLIAPFIPAGFYYKTFKGWPGWMAFEPLIRRAAGLGRAPALPDPDRYEAVNRHCDVLVVGGGPAGPDGGARRRPLGRARDPLRGDRGARRHAALARSGDAIARREGACRVGRRHSRRARGDAGGDGPHAHHRLRLLLAQFRRALGARHRPSAAEASAASGLPRQRLWRVRAKEVVLATGSIERPLVFHENDRPGIMLAGAVRTYMHRYGVLPGKRIVVATNNDSGWDAALDMARAGGEVAAVVDLRSEMAQAHLAEAARRGIAHLRQRHHRRHRGPPPHQPRRGAPARRTTASAAARWRSTATCSPSPAAGRRTWRSSPSRAASSATTSRSRRSVPGRSWQHERSAGAANGIFGMAECFAEGARAGAEAARAAGFDAAPPRIPHVPASGQIGQGPIRVIPELPSNRPKHKVRAFIDLQDDVTTKDLGLAVQEGYRSVEHAKRYTTARHGDRPGQGREPERLRLPRLGPRRDDCRRSARRPSASPTSR